jgi:DNA sulfur modification protein DndE
MADRLYTSSESEEILSALRFETKLEKYILARMAFALSLAIDGSDIPTSTNISGGEMKRPTFVGNDELFLKATLGYAHKIPDIAEDHF